MTAHPANCRGQRIKHANGAEARGRREEQRLAVRPTLRSPAGNPVRSRLCLGGSRELTEPGALGREAGQWQEGRRGAGTRGPRSVSVKDGDTATEPRAEPHGTTGTPRAFRDVPLLQAWHRWATPAARPRRLEEGGTSLPCLQPFLKPRRHGRSGPVGTPRIPAAPTPPGAIATRGSGLGAWPRFAPPPRPARRDVTTTPRPSRCPDEAVPPAAGGAAAVTGDALR